MKSIKLISCLCVAMLSQLAYADSVGMPKNTPKAYETECASCHMAYPPGLLPNKNWQNIMQNLDKHFGNDATMDAKSLQEISVWLKKNAANWVSKYGQSSLENRITKTAWFERKHKEIGLAIWQRPSIKTKANCTACHTTGAKGDFSDDDVKIPAK